MYPGKSFTLKITEGSVCTNVWEAQPEIPRAMRTSAKNNAAFFVHGRIKNPLSNV